MGKTARSLLVVIVVLGAVGAATWYGSGATAPKATKPSGPAGCKPIAGGQLVVLADDKNLQAANNIIPAVHSKVATPELMAALNEVSAALTPERLVELNKATDVDRKTSKAAAEEFAESVKLVDGIRGGAGGRVVIGASNVSESQTLSFVYQIALTAAGYDARVQPVGSRDAYEPELESGEVHVVPEYLSTLTEFLNQKVNGTEVKPVASGDVDKTVSELKGLGKRRGLKIGKPAKATAQNGFAVTKALADRHNLASLSDFAAKCSGRATVLAGPEECPRSGFCQPGLEETYGLKVGQFRSLDAGGPQTKQALTSGTATIGLVFTSDAALAS